MRVILSSACAPADTLLCNQHKQCIKFVMESSSPTLDNSNLAASEKTEVIYGAENVLNWALKELSRTEKTLDTCGGHEGPAVMVVNEPILRKYIELHDKGVKQRTITEITKENISYCKKMMEFQELRHLDGIKGYLSIADGKMLVSHVHGDGANQFPHAVASTVKIFVQQQQYFFDTLWSKAIPARERIKEIEQGSKREFVEVIRDPSEIQKIAFDLINKAEEEIQIIFSATNALHYEERAGMLQLVKEVAATSSRRGLKIRIRVPEDRVMINETNATRELANTGIEIRDIKKPLQENLITLVIDQSFVLTIELKDNGDSKSPSKDVIALATYSNSDSSILTYGTIFENMWMQAELSNHRHNARLTMD